MNSGRNRDALPLVSIVIPARNEARHLPRVFAALAVLDYPAERREMILVDNGSTDDTVAIAQRCGARVLSARGVNVGEVRNTGARAARGEILAFVDADCLVAPRWIDAAVALLDDPQVGAVGGNCTVGEHGNWIQRAWTVEEETTTRDAAALATASLIIRRRTFDELGGFDAALGAGEDDDLSRRVRAAGYRLPRSPECSVIHLGYPETLLGVLQRQLWHGRSQLQGGGIDPMLLLTHLFAILLLVVLPAGVLLGAWHLAAAAIGGSLAAAALPALRKELRGRRVSRVRLMQRVVVYWWFLLGRAAGLVLNYGDRVAASWRSWRVGEKAG